MKDEVERLVSEIVKSVKTIRTSGNEFEIEKQKKMIEEIAENIITELDYEKRNT
jgi:hypothetical protein